MQDELDWIPLGHRMGFLKHPDSEDFKCPVCGYEQYTVYMLPPKACPRCHTEMKTGFEYHLFESEIGELVVPSTKEVSDAGRNE